MKKCNDRRVKKTVTPEPKLHKFESLTGGLKALIIGVLMILLAYGPFPRGLFFEEQWLPAAILVGILFILFWIYRQMTGDGSFLENSMDVSLIALTCAYFLSIFVAAGVRLAIGEWIKYCMYFSVYLMISHLLKHWRERVAVLYVLAFSAVGVCFLGIDEAINGPIIPWLNQLLSFLHINFSFEGLMVENRIGSTLQYANALAAYLLALFILCLALSAVSASRREKTLLSGINYVFLLTFILTVSRGAFLLFPVMCVIFLFLLPREERFKAGVYGVFCALTAVPVSIVLSGFINAAQGVGFKAWLTVAGGLLISLLLSNIGDSIICSLRKLSWKLHLAIGGVLIMSVAGVVFLVFTLSEPLVLQSKDGTGGEKYQVQKSISLKSKKEYKLVYNVSASNSENAAYGIKIASKDEKEAVFYWQKSLENFTGQATRKAHRQELYFKVPEGSKVVDILFSNEDPKEKVTFYDASIIDPETGKEVKNLILKYKYAPDKIIGRFAALKGASTGIIRLIYYQDGLKIIRDHLFLGAGGGAWSLLYFSYQSFLYWTTEAHSYIIQLGVECGLAGLLALGAFLYGIIAFFYRIYKKKDDLEIRELVLHTALLIAILTVFLHSVIDLDLSIPFIAVFVWTLAGIYSAGLRHMKIKSTRFHGKPLNLYPLVGVAAAVILVIIPIMLLSASKSAAAGVNASKKNDLLLTRSSMEKAIRLDPYKAEYRLIYANMLTDNTACTKEDFDSANQYVQEAQSLARNNAELMAGIASYYMATGNIENSLKAINQAVKLRPLRPDDWQQKLEAYTQSILALFGKGDTPQALKLIDEALKAVEEAEEVNRKAIKPFVFNSGTSEMLERIQYIKDNIKVEKAVDISSIVFYSLNSMDINSNGEPDQWLKDANTEIRLEGNEMAVVNKTQGRKGFITSRRLNLLPGKKYFIEAEIENKTPNDTIPFSITEGVKQSSVLTFSKGIYTGSFTTDMDFTAVNPCLRLEVDKQYNIKKMKIINQ